MTDAGAWLHTDQNGGIGDQRQEGGGQFLSVDGVAGTASEIGAVSLMVAISSV
jgi:hypothetical protein